MENSEIGYVFMTEYSYNMISKAVCASVFGYVLNADWQFMRYYFLAKIRLSTIIPAMAYNSGASSQNHGVVDQKLGVKVNLGDLVWVKDDALWWPAQVVNENNINGGFKPRNTKSMGDVLVRLYGRYKFLYANLVKYRSDFKIVEEQNGGSFDEIFRKTLELDYIRGKTDVAKDKSAGKSDDGNKPRSKTREQNGTPKSLKRKKETRKDRVKRELGLKAPKGSPFKRNGHMSSSDDSESDGCKRALTTATRYPFRFPLFSVEESFDIQLRKFSAVSSKSAVLSLAEEPAQEYDSNKVQNATKSDTPQDLFDDMKHRFLSFKKHKYLEERERFQDLAKVQRPKVVEKNRVYFQSFRVCPSNILGFQPGEAFMVRNVANLVPPSEKGACETNAALEFAVTSLEVENILIVGHSCCAGIERLMTMQDYAASSSFAEKWVEKGKIAKLRTKADAAHLSFDKQCQYCEKESINQSLKNLLTYPWINDRVRKELLHVHGGYYDFRNCTFEKWTYDYKRSREGKYAIKDTSFWC
ncbi:hypothetical protein ACFE04_011578 [Oxalis oulophora]